MITWESFGRTADGEAVTLFTLKNASGAFVKIMDYGCTIKEIWVPDRDGRLSNVCLGYDKIEDYQRNNGYFGAVVGRYANRIAKAKFSLNGTEYTLASNDGQNHLHGGEKGFDRYVWRHEIQGDALIFRRTSPHMEEGYPGNLEVKVTYQWGEDNALTITYDADCDRDTVVNLTNHCYFNLKGEGDILGHLLKLNAQQYTPVDAETIPIGKNYPVEGTPFDFREAKAIGKEIGADCEQLRNGGGYDHNFVLDGSGMRQGAAVAEPATGRRMEMFTTQPGVQFYSGNFISSRTEKIAFQPRQGFCLETQHFPDSPNRPDFPSTVLRKGEHYCHTTVYAFSVQK